MNKINSQFEYIEDRSALLNEQNRLHLTENLLKTGNLTSAMTGHKLLTSEMLEDSFSKVKLYTLSTIQAGNNKKYIVVAGREVFNIGSRWGEKVGEIKTGDVVQIDSNVPSTIEDGTEWVKIIYDGGKTGWVPRSVLREDSGNSSLSLSKKGADFTALCEGHQDVLSNGNYAVIDTNDGKLTTYGGLTIAERENGTWVPINNFTQSQVDNRSQGIDPTVWKRNYDTYRSGSTTHINDFADDNSLVFTQYQFDALMDFCWVNGNVIRQKESNGTYTYEFVNIMLEPGFLTNPTPIQKYRFESAFGNLVSMGGIRTSGIWARRMSQLSVFWGETDINGNYIRKDYGNSQQTKIAADAWLTSRGLAPTAR